MSRHIRIDNEELNSKRKFACLTPAEAERLALLLEELGEAQQAIGKILRHGYENRHPDGGATNREALCRELGDVLCALELMCQAGDLSDVIINAGAELKHQRVGQYLHHQASERAREER